MVDFITKMFYKKRAEFEKMSANRDKTLPMPKGITKYFDISYSEDNKKTHRLDIYRPSDKEGEILPVIVNLHGGGLLLGSKEFNRVFCANLSLMGYLVFSIEFGLVPECSAYDIFNDVATAMNFIDKNIEKYNGDSKHTYMVADSGGAYLAVYSMALQKCPSMAKAAGVTPSSLKINAMGLISGMFYTTRFDQIGIFLPKYLYGKNYKNGAFAPYVNPEHPDIVTSLPPCFLVTSDADNLKHYSLDFADALTKYNVIYKIRLYKNNKRLTHAFSVFEPYYRESIDTLKGITKFLNEY